MTSTTTCTVTLTKEELADLRAALYEASSYWYSHLRRAQSTDCELDETGCRYVWEARMKLAAQWETVFEQHFRDA